MQVIKWGSRHPSQNMLVNIGIIEPNRVLYSWPFRPFWSSILGCKTNHGILLLQITEISPKFSNSASIFSLSYLFLRNGIKPMPETIPRKITINGWYKPSKYGWFVIVLAGWWFEPLWKILVNWDDYSQYMGNKKCSKPPTSYCFSHITENDHTLWAPWTLLSLRWSAPSRRCALHGQNWAVPGLQDAHRGTVCLSLLLLYIYI